MSRIGFIGLGNMGLPMAQNLLKAGHQIEGVDFNPASLEKLKASGGTAVETHKIAAARADVVITMLPSGKEVREVYLGPNGIIENANPGTLLIDCSTIDVNSARVVAAEAEKERTVDARCAGVRRRRRRRRGHAHVHGRWQRARLHSRGIHFAEDGQDHRARRRRRNRAGGQDLQQHDPRRFDDRGVGSFRSRGKSRSRSSKAVRYLVEIVGPVLVAERPIARFRGRCRHRPPIATTRRVSRRR